MLNVNSQELTCYFSLKTGKMNIIRNKDLHIFRKTRSFIALF